MSFANIKHITRFHAPFPLPLNVSKSSNQIHIYAQCLDMMIFLCGWMYEKSILLFNYVIQMFDRYPLLSGANKEKKYVSSFTRCLCTKSVFMEKHKNIIGSRLNENIFMNIFFFFTYWRIIRCTDNSNIPVDHICYELIWIISCVPKIY